MADELAIILESLADEHIDDVLAIERELDCLGFFQRMQVLAEHVLRNGDGQGLLVVELAHDDGDLFEPCQSRRPPATLSGTNLEPFGLGRMRPNNDRL